MNLLRPSFLLALDARVEPGRWDGPAEGDGELGSWKLVLLVVRDERVQRVEGDLKAIIQYALHAGCMVIGHMVKLVMWSTLTQM